MTLDNMDLTGIVSQMEADELDELKKNIKKRRYELRTKRYLKLMTYVPLKTIPEFNLAREWAFSKKLIKYNTPEHFIQFCMLNMIEMIIREVGPAAIQHTASEAATQTPSSTPQQTPSKMPQDETEGITPLPAMQKIPTESLQQHSEKANENSGAAPQ